MVNAIELARALIRCPSVTPADAGALSVLEDALTAGGEDPLTVYQRISRILARRKT